MKENCQKGPPPPGGFLFVYFLALLELTGKLQPAGVGVYYMNNPLGGIQPKVTESRAKGVSRYR